MKDENVKAAKIIVEGIVQGVNFRYYVKNCAQKLKLVGTVRNKSDGTVEVITEGEENKMFELIKLIKIGSPSSKVYSTDIEWRKPEKKHSHFQIVF